MANIKRRPLGEESIEAKTGSITSEARAVGKQFTESLWKDFLGKGVAGIPEQLMGVTIVERELAPGEEVSLKEKKEKKPTSAEHLEYFREVRSVDMISENGQERQLRTQVDEIRMEIRKLIKTSKIVEVTVKGAASEQAPVRPGKYHVSFFEFVLNIIKDATRKLEDSVSFGAILQGKKKHKRQHWTKVKSQGTQFGLSGERTSATQTG